MTSFSIDAEAMKSVVTKAILEGISQERRDVILEQAVSHIVTPGRDTYGRSGDTPVQEAFRQALDVVVRTAALEVVESNAELVERVKTLIAEQVAAVLAEESYGQLAQATRRGFAEVLTNFTERGY